MEIHVLMNGRHLIGYGLVQQLDAGFVHGSNPPSESVG
jgi:hypothetical protein